MKKVAYTLLLGTSIILSGQAQAGLIKDGVWKIEEGDTLKGILKSTLPDEPLRQKRLERLSKLINKKAHDSKGNLIVGQHLRLPGVTLPKAVNAEPSKQIGRVLITNGATIATSEDGTERPLKRGSAINQGDTIETKGARAQVRFTDGSLLALRPNTQFKVEEYSYNGAQDGSERGIYNLLKGGFRTISGAIGKANKDNYRVKTPVATIGIRGTHYGITLCISGSCANQGLKDGLYGGVVDGSIQTSNDGGTSIFNNDEYFLISDLGSLAKQLLAPPGVIFDDPASPPSPPNQEGQKEQKSPQQKRAEEVVKSILRKKRPDFDGTLDADQIREIVVAVRQALGEIANTTTSEPTQPTHPSLPGNTATNGTIAAFSFVGVNPNPLSSSGIDTVATSIRHNGTTQNISTGPLPGHSNTLRGLSFEKNESNTLKIIASIIGTDVSNLMNTGVDSNLGFIWGRWTNTPIRAEATGGVTAQSTPTTGIMYTVADPSKVITTASSLLSKASALSAQSPSLSFAPTGGGVLAVDLTGTQSSATSYSRSLSLNLTNQTLAFNLSIPVNQDSYSLATGNVAIASIINPGSHADLTGQCSGSICGETTGLTGKANFTFTDSGSSSLGAAVNYSAQGIATNLQGVPTIPVGIAGTEIFQASVVPQ